MKRSVSLLVLLLVPVLVSAKSRHLTLEGVRDQAESIFIGRVMSSSVRPVLNGTAVTTDYVVEVSEVLYGRVDKTTTVSYFGSAKFRVEDSPLLEQGRSYLFFRTPQPNNTTVGWGAGLFTLETATVENQKRTVLISGEGAPLMNLNGALHSGAPVLVRNGAIVPRPVSTTAAEPKDTNAVAETDNIRMLPRQKQAATTAAAPPGTFATLDDLRAFVRAKRAGSSKEKP